MGNGAGSKQKYKKCPDIVSMDDGQCDAKSHRRDSKGSGGSSDSTEVGTEEADGGQESEIAFLRRMLQKEKADKEWVMARYEVAEFYLKAKDEEIVRLRQLVSKCSTSSLDTPASSSMSPAAAEACRRASSREPIKTTTPSPNLFIRRRSKDTIRTGSKQSNCSSQLSGVSEDGYNSPSDAVTKAAGFQIETPPQVQQHSRRLSERRGLTLQACRPEKQPTPDMAKYRIKDSPLISRRNSCPIISPQGVPGTISEGLQVTPAKTPWLKQPHSPKRVYKADEAWEEKQEFKRRIASLQTSLLPIRRSSDPSFGAGLGVQPTKVEWLGDSGAASPKRVLSKARTGWSSNANLHVHRADAS